MSSVARAQKDVPNYCYYKSPSDMIFNLFPRVDLQKGHSALCQVNIKNSLEFDSVLVMLAIFCKALNFKDPQLDVNQKGVLKTRIVIIIPHKQFSLVRSFKEECVSEDLFRRKLELLIFKKLKVPQQITHEEGMMIHIYEITKNEVFGQMKKFTRLSYESGSRMLESFSLGIQSQLIDKAVKILELKAESTPLQIALLVSSKSEAKEQSALSDVQEAG